MSTDELSQRIGNIEREILDIKTAIIRTNSSTAGIWQSTGVLSVGSYMITYSSGQFPIMSTIEASFRTVSPKTPVGNTQVFELIGNSRVRITSTRKIISVESA